MGGVSGPWLVHGDHGLQLEISAPSATRRPGDRGGADSNLRADPGFRELDLPIHYNKSPDYTSTRHPHWTTS